MKLFFRRTDEVGVWIRHERLFDEDTYECSICGASFSERADTCPNCHSVMSEEEYDPDWVDEMEEME